MDILGDRKELDEEAWDLMQGDDISHIMNNLFNTLPQEKREVLIQLSFAGYFDEDLFHRLFSGRLFEMYRSWFSGSMFTNTPEKGFSVQSGMKKAVMSYINSVNYKIANECRRNLFNAVKNKLMSLKNKDAKITIDITEELKSLISYGENLRNEEFYVQTIISMRSLFWYSGNSKLYLEELGKIKKIIEESKEQYNYLHIKKIMASILFELAFTEFQTGFYKEAYDNVNDGIFLAKELKDDILLQKFIGIQMYLIDISPQSLDKSSDSVGHALMMSKEYLDLLEKNRDSLSYKEYIQCKISACLFQSDEYRTRQDFDSAWNCLTEPLEICSNPNNLRLMELFRLYACTLEHAGVIKESLDNYQQAREYYIKSIEQYHLAELFEQSWDSDFYLSWGLVLKRLGETEFHLDGMAQSSFDNIDKALNKYKTVAEHNPDTIDTYCKIGFACTDSMQKILTLPDISFNPLKSHFKSYLRDCKKAIDTANKCMSSDSNGNRQIMNITCSLSRNEGMFLQRCGKIDEAKKAFCNAIEVGQDTVNHFPNHPYSYLGLANSCLAYKDFLKETGEETNAKKYANIGIEAIKTSRKFTTDSNSFSDVYAKLQE